MASKPIYSNVLPHVGLHLGFTSQTQNKRCFRNISHQPALTLCFLAITDIQDAVSANDSLRFQQIRQSVQNAIAAGSSARSTTLPLPTMSLPATASSMPYPPSGEHGKGYTNGSRQPAAVGAAYGQSLRLNFKPSPFYQIESPISDVRTCEGWSISFQSLEPSAILTRFLAMSQHRNSVSVPIKLNDHASLQKCVNDKSYRILVFCASDTSGVQDIAFPHQSELRANGGEIKANLRGLKNKPGSTRPVDITSALRLRPNYSNTLDFTYALTNKVGLTLNQWSRLKTRPFFWMIVKGSLT